MASKKSRIGCLGTIIIIVVLLAAIGAFFDFLEKRSEQKKLKEQARIAEQKAKEAAERRARLRREAIEYFKNNRSSILTQIHDQYQKGKYQEAVSIAKKYLASNDPQLRALYEKSKAVVDQIRREKREKEILAQLKRIPAREYEKNKNLYAELISLRPENARYKQKHAYYSRKLKEQQEKERLARERQKRIKSQFSAWNGAHRNLEKVIKKLMNDPDSYKHVETVYWDMGDYLIVQTTFRGKNAFGGIVTNSVKAKVDLDGNVLQILKQR